MKWFVCVALGLLSLTACSNDPPTYPDLLTSFVDMRIASNGQDHWMQTDDGQQYSVTYMCDMKDLVRDSLYRMVGRYELLDNHKAKVYAVAKTVSSAPQHFAEFYTDPVKVQSIWQSGSYLNLVLQVMVHDVQHEFAFATEQIDKTNMRITLCHDRKDDIEGFYEKVYVSVPLTQYAQWMNDGKALEFCVNTYEGMRSYSLKPF